MAAKRGKGCYNVTPEWREKMRENVAKAREVMQRDPKMKAVRHETGKKVAGVLVARAILKAFPAGAKAGDVVRTSNRRFTVIDPVPVECSDGSGKWEQKFEQDGRFTVYGVTKIFKGRCRIVWDGRPNVADMADGALFEQEETPEMKDERQEMREEKTAFCNSFPGSEPECK